jgi:predicted nucleotidyltransferase
MAEADEMDINEEIRTLCEQIARDFQPDRIIMFGSHAYGEPSPDSDVDLLVVMPFEGSSRQQAVNIRNRIAACAARLDRPYPRRDFGTARPW